jgi:hypothetical protein
MEPNKFISKINKEGGLARTNRYRVEVVPPLIMGTIQGFTSILSSLTGVFNTANAARYYAMFGVNPIGVMENLEIFCDSCVLPGANYITTERKIYGPVAKHPYDQNFDPVTFSFICGANMKERYFFDAWQYSVKDPVTNDYNYQSEYTTQILIKQYDVSGEFKYGVRLTEAWPSNVNSIELSYGEEGTCRVNVEISFRQWFNIKAYDTFAGDIGSIIKNNGV